MAIGNADAEMNRDKIKIYINGIQISEEGKSISFHYQSVLSALNNFNVDIKDHMYVINDNTLINYTKISKFFIPIAETQLLYKNL